MAILMTEDFKSSFNTDEPIITPRANALAKTYCKFYLNDSIAGCLYSGHCCKNILNGR